MNPLQNQSKIFSFNDLSPSLLKSTKELEYKEPTEIQAVAIPYLLNHDGDFVGQAKTGTGKTAAFGLPLLEHLDFNSDQIEALILTPTRELAHQVLNEINKFSKYLPLRAISVYGGESYTKQISGLKHTKPQLIVGTPGRIIDLMKRGVLKAKQCKRLIIDEADEMLNRGFLDDINIILDELSDKKKIWMFSATMPAPITKLVNEKFNNPYIIRSISKVVSNENISQYYSILEKKDFPKAICRVVEKEESCFGIVFCQTKVDVINFTSKILHMGHKAAALHGDLNQSQRDMAMSEFKDKRVNILVCTDVASRGIDVEHISHVFNIGIPNQKEVYIHRVGRTGRGSNKGDAISFITPSETYKLRQLEQFIKHKLVEYALPKTVELKQAKVARELEKMNGLKEALMRSEQEFNIDETYSLFREFLKDLSKEQILKLLFSFRFKKAFFKIEDELQSLPMNEFKTGRMRSFNRRDSRGNSGSQNSRRNDRFSRTKGRKRRSSER